MSSPYHPIDSPRPSALMTPRPRMLPVPGCSALHLTGRLLCSPLCALHALCVLLLPPLPPSPSEQPATAGAAALRPAPAAPTASPIPPSSPVPPATPSKPAIAPKPKVAARRSVVERDRGRDSAANEVSVATGALVVVGSGVGGVIVLRVITSLVSVCHRCVVQNLLKLMFNWNVNNFVEVACSTGNCAVC